MESAPPPWEKTLSPTAQSLLIYLRAHAVDYSKLTYISFVGNQGCGKTTIAYILSFLLMHQDMKKKCIHYRIIILP